MGACFLECLFTPLASSVLDHESPRRSARGGDEELRTVGRRSIRLLRRPKYRDDGGRSPLRGSFCNQKTIAAAGRRFTPRRKKQPCLVPVRRRHSFWTSNQVRGPAGF